MSASSRRSRTWPAPQEPGRRGGDHPERRRSRASTRSTARSGARPSRQTRRAPARPSSASSTTATAPRPTSTSTPRSSPRASGTRRSTRSPAFDAAFTEFQAAVGVDAQKAACTKIETILNEDVPVGLPYFYNYLAGNSKKFTGVFSSALGQMSFSADLDRSDPDRVGTMAAGHRPRLTIRLELRREEPMARFISRRLLLSLLTLWLLATIVFIIANVLPNDVGRTILGPFAPQETVDALNERLGTNRPLFVRYVESMRRHRHPRLRRLVRLRPAGPAAAARRDRSGRPSWPGSPC